MKTAVVLGLDLMLCVKSGRDPLQAFEGSSRFSTAFSEPDPVLSTWHNGGETQEGLPDL